MLTADRLRQLFSYDPDTGIFQRKKIVTNSKRIAGSMSEKGYMTIHCDGKNRKAHRMAWLYIYGYEPALIDHINGCKSDNRISNLREVTISENLQNRATPYANNARGVLGVYAHYKGKFQARIQVNGKSKSLGLFDTVSAASDAYWSAKKKYHPASAIPRQC